MRMSLPPCRPPRIDTEELQPVTADDICNPGMSLGELSHPPPDSPIEVEIMFSDTSGYATYDNVMSDPSLWEIPSIIPIVSKRDEQEFSIQAHLLK